MTTTELINKFIFHRDDLLARVESLRLRKGRHCFDMKGWNAVYDKGENRFVSLTAFCDEGLFTRVKFTV